MRQIPERPTISCENDLGPLIVGTGTHEGKAILLGGMRPGVSYGQTALHEELFIEPQGINPVYTGTPSNKMDYCRLSLAVAGCVVLDPEETQKKYMLTPLGEYEGQAYAGHALALSLDAGDMGLRAIYGMSRGHSGHANRQALDRLSIFRQLLATDELQATQVTDALGAADSTVRRNLRWLTENGIVEYEGIDARDHSDHITYIFPEKPDLDAGPHKVMGMIYATITELTAAGTREVTLNDFMDELQARYPDEGFDQPKRRGTTTARMIKLTEEGKIQKQADHDGKRSNLTLVETARPVVERAVAIADGMLSGDNSFLHEGKRSLRNILRDEAAVRTLVSKAYAASPEANRIPWEQRAAYITEYLEQHPRATLKEVAEGLAETGMTFHAVRGTSITMRGKGLLTSEAVKRQAQHVWSVHPAADMSLAA